MHKRVGWLCTLALLSSWAYSCGPDWLLEQLPAGSRMLPESFFSASSAGQQPLPVSEKRVQKDTKRSSSDEGRGNNGRITEILEMVRNLSKRDRELLLGDFLNKTN